MLTNLLLTAIVGTIPLGEPVTDVCEVIEKNHYVMCANPDGTPRLQTQWVLWESSRDGREQVVAWQMHKAGDSITRTTDGWRLRCGNQLEGFQRQIEAVSYRETWTNFDVEVVDREKHAAEKRRGLSTNKQSLRNVSLLHN
jgi:hypothetical protein